MPHQIIPEAITLQDDGLIPNNAGLPLLVYRQALRRGDVLSEAAIEALFENNDWGRCWRNGIFGYHHYHPDAHEVLGIAGGNAEVQFGGGDGPVLSVTAGDVVVIPAGVGHCRKSPAQGLRVIGGYPAGQSYQTFRASETEHAEALVLIARVTCPLRDPLYGVEGPLLVLWR